MSEPTLVVPDHGRGLIKTGGNPGNKGGSGRPPERIRVTARQMLEEDVLPEMQRIVKEGENDGHKIAAGRTISDIGMPKQHEQTIVLNNTIVYDAWADCVGELLGVEILGQLQALVKERLPENWQGD